MNKEVKQFLESQLRPGYRFGEANSSGLYPVLNPEGDIVRTPSGQPVVSNLSGGGWHIRRRTLKNLRDAGVIKPPRTRSHSPDEKSYKQTKPSEIKGPVVLATEILRDTSATPRERRVAKSYLESVETIKKLREFGQQLADRIYELQRELDKPQKVRS